MTNLPEAKLAREAEIALATMAMITDYDCWKVEEEPVSAQTVFEHLIANAETAKKVLAAGDSANPDRTELARTPRPGFRLGDGPQALAGGDASRNLAAILGRFTVGDGRLAKMSSRFAKIVLANRESKYSNYKRPSGRNPDLTPPRSP